MSKNGRCHGCDATGGAHYPGCDYDGTNSGRGYSSGSSNFARGLVLALAFLLGIPCPPFGFIFMWIFMNM